MDGSTPSPQGLSLVPFYNKPNFLINVAKSTPIIITPKTEKAEPLLFKVNKQLDHPSSYSDVERRAKQRHAKLIKAAERATERGDIKTAKLLKEAARFVDYNTADPYTSPLQNMMEDAILTDGNVQKAVKLLIAFTLGSKREPVIVTRFGKEDTDIGQATAFNGKTYSHEDILGIIRMIEKKRSVKFDMRLKGLMKQAYAFGRAALGIEYGTISYNGQEYPDLPVALKPFSSRNLGKVYIDPESWEVTEVIYSDSSSRGKTPTKVSIDDMIYLLHEDDNTKPDSLGYGHSRLLSSIHWSEITRIAAERDIKEIFMTLWAGVLVAKLNTRNTATAQAIARQLVDAGTVTVTNQDVELEALAIEQHLDQLMAALKDISTIIARNIGVPSALMNQEEIQNHATLDGVLQAWEKSDLKSERTTLNDCIDSQWYDRILMRLYGVKDPDLLPIKVTSQSTPISFLDWTDMAAPVLQIMDKGLLTDEDAVELMGLPEKYRENITKARAQMEQKKAKEAEEFRKQNTRFVKAE